MRKGPATRERILEIAEEAVLAKGFSATSIEELIAEAEITKSGFFYHFRDKNALARGLLERYIRQNDQLLEELSGRACELTDDPLQQLLIGLTLLAEHMAAMPDGHPGCLVATMSYQDRLFDRDIREKIAQTVRDWNDFFRQRLEAIVAVYPTRDPVKVDELARMVSCVIDGGIMMGKALSQPGVLPEQILMVRGYIKMLFAPALAQPARAA